MHFLLFYDLVDDVVQKRVPYRAAHLAHAEAAVGRGELVLAGALTEPVDTSVFLFQGATPEAAEHFAKQDPYVQNGLVKSWRVRGWSTVVGRDAATPLSSASLR